MEECIKLLRNYLERYTSVLSNIFCLHRLSNHWEKSLIEIQISIDEKYTNSNNLRV